AALTATVVPKGRVTYLHEERSSRGVVFEVILWATCDDGQVGNRFRPRPKADGLLNTNVEPSSEGQRENLSILVDSAGVGRIDCQHLVNHSFDHPRALADQARLAEFVKLLDGPALRFGTTDSLHNRHETLPEHSPETGAFFTPAATPHPPAP